MTLAGEHLRARRVVRPPVDTLVRMIATARADAHRHVEQLLAVQLAPARRRELDTGLEPGDMVLSADAPGCGTSRASAATGRWSPSDSTPASRLPQGRVNQGLRVTARGRGAS